MCEVQLKEKKVIHSESNVKKIHGESMCGVQLKDRKRSMVRAMCEVQLKDRKRSLVRTMCEVQLKDRKKDLIEKDP